MTLHPDLSPTRVGELAYEKKRRALSLSRIRVGAVLAGVLLPFGLILDLFTPTHDPNALLIIRAVAIVGCLGIYGISWWPGMVRWAHALSYLLAGGLAVGAELMLIFGAGLTSHYYAGLAVIMIAVGLLFPWSIRQTASFSLFFLAVYLAPAAFAGPELDLPMLLSNAYFLANCGLVAVVGGALSQRLRRREFFGRLALEDQTQRLEEASLQLAANLSQMSELERAKTRFYAKVNHEFRTPLSLIAAPLEELTVDDAFSLPSDVRKRLELVQRNVERLRTLVDQVLEMARIGQEEGEPRLRPVPLEALVQEVSSEFEDYAASRGVRIEIEGTLERPLRSLPSAIETILRNLLSNAIKFMPDGGEVLVTLEDGREACALTVADRGLGIPEEEWERIFELFARVERPDGPKIPGSGVGLAITQELVRQIQGHLEVTHTPGGGATFRLTLPRIHAT